MQDFRNLKPGTGFETPDRYRIERAQDDQGGQRAIDAYYAINTNVYGPMSLPKDQRFDHTFGNDPDGAFAAYQKDRQRISGSSSPTKTTSR